MKKLLGIAIGIASVLFALVGAPCTNAEEKNMAPFIGISPYKATMELKPGETYTGQFRVSNIGESSFKYIIEVSPYQVTDDHYTSDFTTMNNYTRIVDWITFDVTSGELEPHTASAPITYTINVPLDIPSGGQFAVIKATVDNNGTKRTTEGFAIENRTSAGMLLYSTINGGNTRAEAKILENKIPSFLSAGPLNAVSLVENTGNIYAEATYSLRVTSIFSDQDIIYTNEDDDENNNISMILPETRRYRQQVWENVPAFGIFKVKQTIKILDEFSEVEQIVIVCPFWLIIVIIIAIIAMVLWLRARHKARKNNY